MNTTTATSPSGKYLANKPCPHCTKVYASRLALAKHIRIKHGA